MKKYKFTIKKNLTDDYGDKYNVINYSKIDSETSGTIIVHNIHDIEEFYNNVIKAFDFPYHPFHDENQVFELVTDYQDYILKNRKWKLKLSDLEDMKERILTENNGEINYKDELKTALTKLYEYTKEEKNMGLKFRDVVSSKIRTCMYLLDKVDTEVEV